MEYNHKKIEEKWQNYWRENATYKTEINKDKKKFWTAKYKSKESAEAGLRGYFASKH